MQPGQDGQLDEAQLVAAALRVQLAHAPGQPQVVGHLGGIIVGHNR
jgi:hypothetical protein